MTERNQEWSPAATAADKPEADAPVKPGPSGVPGSRGKRQHESVPATADKSRRVPAREPGEPERAGSSPEQSGDRDQGVSGGSAAGENEQQQRGEARGRRGGGQPVRKDKSGRREKPDRKGGGGSRKSRKPEGKQKERSHSPGSGGRPAARSTRPSLASGPGLPAAAGFEDPEELARRAAEAGRGEPLEVAPFHDLALNDLMAQAETLGVRLNSAPARRLLTEKMILAASEAGRPVVDEGILFVADEGHGFIVRHQNNYQLQPEDPYVAPSFIRRYGLKPGHHLRVQLRPPVEGERCPAVLKLFQVMGDDPERVSRLPPFEDLIPYYPLERILLEAPDSEGKKDVSMRAVDVLTPVGFGQRGLIVAAPRTGKTLLLQGFSNSIARNKPESRLIILLVDERPEEVTDFRRRAQGEVISSTFDEGPEHHVHAAEMVLEKARRLVEAGEDVVILLDSITRLARAYNALMPSGGKMLSGGVEATALQKPKRFFGSARNIEEGGSLTILATALVETGSRMDEVIFEEFKGTGNMELHLDRSLVEKRIFPAINIEKSGTRKEELLYHPDEMERIYSLRRAMQGVPIVESMEMFIQRLKNTETNAEFLMTMNR